MAVRRYILTRLSYMLILLLLISFVAFAIIWIMPGDFLTALQLDPQVSQELLEDLRQTYGLDQPFHEQYGIWVWRVLCCLDFGLSFNTRQSSWTELTGSGRIWYSLILFAVTSLVGFILSGMYSIYSATHRNSVLVHIADSVSDIGAAVPPFILALVLLEFLIGVLKVGTWTTIDPSGFSATGLFDPEYITVPWSWAKFANFLWHLWPAVLVIGLANGILLMRELRSHLLQVLNQPYVYVARAKGLEERVVTWRHALRNALIPPISILGLWFSYLFGGLLVASIVLNLPTMEYQFWLALVRQDQNVVLAGIVLFSAILMFLNLLADVLLAYVDPRISYYD